MASRLADRLGLEPVELDALYWQPNWTPAPLEDFRASVTQAIRSNGWVVAGNYHVVRDLIWPRAEAVVWLDYPFATVLWRLLTRTVRRSMTGEELWNGNREHFGKQLRVWSEDSLIHWFFKSYWRRKREIPLLLSMPEHVHLALIHLHTPREAETWLNQLAG
jgi:adenylate kinase family enzyme